MSMIRLSGRDRVDGDVSGVVCRASCSGAW